MNRAVPRSFVPMATAMARDLLRTPMTTISMVTVFVTFLLVYALLQWAISAQGDDVDMLGPNLGVLLMAGFAAIALVGTAVPVVAMRERGTLRVFATTPLSRLVFVLALLPVRVAIALVEIAVVAVIAAALGDADPGALARLLVTGVVGLAMLLAIGLLVASRARSAEATQQSMAMLSIVLVFASGGLVPEQVVPGWATAAMRVLPTTWFADAIREDTIGRAAFAPVPLLWLGMLVVGAASLAWAVRRFDWDGRRWEAGGAAAASASLPAPGPATSGPAVSGPASSSRPASGFHPASDPRPDQRSPR